MITNLGVIPARGGSKTLPGKNIKLLNGKPLIAYTIEAALASKKLDRLIVSTDDIEIKEIAVQYGAEVPFMRPAELSGDKSSDFDVLKHVIDWIGDNEHEEVNNLIYLRPTTPFKTGALIDTCIEKLDSDNFTGLRSVTKVDGVHHPYWMYKDFNLTLKSFVDGIDISNYFQRQLLPVCYRLNGVVDIIRSETLNQKSLYGDRIGFVEVDDIPSVDIDTELDFKYCEFLIKNSYST